MQGGRLATLWRDLGIPADLRLSGEKRFTAQPDQIDCAEGCKADAVIYAHLLPDGEDSVLRVCNAFGTTCRFLLLHDAGPGWQLVDYVDSPLEKYAAPTVSIEASQDRRWLVRRGFGGGGTGVYLAVSDWFEVQCGALHQVLTVPAAGYDVDARPSRYFSTRFRTFRKLGSTESLEFGFVIAFGGYPYDPELWQEERTVVFSRSGPNAAFVFDPAQSGISKTIMDKLFAFDSLDENDFVEFAYDRLRAIALHPADARRSWLSDYLSQMEATPKVKALEALLK